MIKLVYCLMAKSVNIAFDFDGIFVNHPLFIPKNLIEKLYKKSNTSLSYRIPGKLEQKVRVLSHFYFLRPPIRKNINSLRIISKNPNFSLFLVSSRFSFLSEQTQKWDKKNEVLAYFKKVFFNQMDEQPHLFKNRIIKEEKIEKFIDDDIELLQYLSKENPKVDFYWVGPSQREGDRLRSTSGDSGGHDINLPKNIKRIKDLEEFRLKYL